MLKEWLDELSDSNTSSLSVYKMITVAHRETQFYSDSSYLLFSGLSFNIEKQQKYWKNRYHIMINSVWILA